jgi:MOSC domain-containing protein YiiM
LSRRWRLKNLALQVQKTGRTGWYFRVLKEGYVERNLPLILLMRPFPQWTIARANEIMHHRLNDRKAAAELAACPLLASNWQQTLSNRATKGINPNPDPRLLGAN